MDTTSDGQNARFSVWLWFDDDSHLLEADNLPPAEAVKLAKRCTERPAAIAGIIQKVTIVDEEDDTTAFLWEHGRGVVFPNLEELRNG
jgi:hypothetical protein